MKIALLGTRGIPARYGGFETAIEEVAPRLAAAGHLVTVYCRSDDAVGTRYKGVERVVLPALKHRVFETLSHTFLSSLHAAKARPDAAIVFNCANAPFVPFLRTAGIPTAVHVDGLEWRRGKWGRTGRRYYRLAERLAVVSANALIADARAIATYIRETYGRESRFIPYGAEPIVAEPGRLEPVNLQSRAFHLVVARLEPENHVDLIVRGYKSSSARFPLVIVGGNPYKTAYSRSVAALGESPRVLALGAVWDQVLLDQLYANCLSYLHGHSVGGTNPSLLRAMGAGAPVTAFDVTFNREVTGGAARFFRTESEVAAALEADEQDLTGAAARGQALRSDALARYSWDDVAVSYEALCLDLGAAGRRAC